MTEEKDSVVDYQLDPDGGLYNHMGKEMLDDHGK